MIKFPCAEKHLFTCFSAAQSSCTQSIDGIHKPVVIIAHRITRQMSSITERCKSLFQYLKINFYVFTKNRATFLFNSKKILPYAFPEVLPQLYALTQYKND